MNDDPKINITVEIGTYRYEEGATYSAEFSINENIDNIVTSVENTIQNHRGNRRFLQKVSQV